MVVMPVHHGGRHSKSKEQIISQEKRKLKKRKTYQKLETRLRLEPWARFIVVVVVVIAFVIVVVVVVIVFVIVVVRVVVVIVFVVVVLSEVTS